MYYLATDTDLESVADAIREKVGRSDPLTFPAEFVSAVQDIPTGGTYEAVEKEYTPRTTSQTETVTPGTGYDAMSSVKVTVNAMPTGVAGTPTASKGAVSNHSVMVTPAVVNTAGYIPGGRKTGTPVTVTASELVDGTLSVDSAGTKDVTNYASAEIPEGTVGTPSTIKGIVSNHSVSVSSSVTVFEGYVEGGVKSGNSVTVTAAELVSGTKAINANGIHDVANYDQVNVQVSSGEIVQPSKSVTPSETAQTVTPDSGYTSMAQVNVGAISSTYVGSDVDRRSSSDLTEASGTVTVPAGYYEAEATKAVASGTVGQPAASKGLVSNHSVAVTPRVTVFAGYVPAAIKTGDAVTVTAAELVSGTKTITENGVHDVTNYEEVSVNVSGGGGGGGGATNMITGTFTTPSTSGAHTLTLPYTGSGYPVALMVFVAGGEYVSGSDWYDAIKRYAVGQFTIAKSNTQTAPSYGTSGAANQGVTSWIYKSSTSSATSYSRSSAMNTNSFSSSNATSTAAQVCRLRSATQLSYYVIGSSGYGLMPETEYRYVVLYSE